MLLFTLAIGFGIYLGYSFREEIEGIAEVHDFFQKDIKLTNTVLPGVVNALIPNSVVSWLETFKFSFEIIWIRLEQFLRRSCTPHGDTSLYCVRFVIHHKPYAFLVRPVLGPTGFAIEDSTGRDITARLEPFIRGPQAVVAPLTPALLGEKSKIRYLSGLTMREIEPNDAL